MKQHSTHRFDRSFVAAPKQVQKAFIKQVTLLLQNFQHPSLRAKKYDETTGLWQARVTGNWRFYFLIVGGTYILVDIQKHKD